MNTIAITPYYLATREQLLRALEAHVRDMLPEHADRTRIAVLGFLDGPASKAEGVLVAPKAITPDPRVVPA